MFVVLLGCGHDEDMSLVSVQGKPVHRHVAGDLLVLEVHPVLQGGGVIVTDAKSGVIGKAANPPAGFTW